MRHRHIGGRQRVSTAHIGATAIRVSAETALITSAASMNPVAGRRGDPGCAGDTGRRRSAGPL